MRYMTTSAKYPTSTKNKDSDFIKRQENFMQILEDLGIKKIADIPAGSHRKSERTDNGVWIIK